MQLLAAPDTQIGVIFEVSPQANGAAALTLDATEAPLQDELEALGIETFVEPAGQH